MSEKGRLPPLVFVSGKYGIVGGLLGFVLLLILYYIGRHPFLIPVFFDFRVLLFLVFIFFTLKELREDQFQGILFFWQGMIASFLFTIVFAVLSSLPLFIFMQLEPDFLSTYISLMEQQLEGLPPEVVERIGKETFEMNVNKLPDTTKWDLTFLYLWQSFMISLFISIILSVILRRQPKTQ
ncbi:MAG: DUF4199 domain-containing protein [Flammeovirgaceae bacterium]|nr:DUF4199 domain-containing protein [Flammeovirgaceae bacterium]